MKWLKFFRLPDDRSDPCELDRARNCANEQEARMELIQTRIRPHKESNHFEQRLQVAFGRLR